MLIHPDTVVAVLKQQMIPEQRQGIGRITKAEGRWYLQTPIERIPLELQPKGVVHEGEAVRYTINDGLISLTTIVADYRHAPTIPGDFFMPSAVPSSTAPQSSPLTAFPVTKIPGGLYLFTSVEEALSFVSQEKNSELRDRILLLLASDGVVAVKVDSGDDGIFRASLLSRAEISLSLTTLQTSFGSTALASIPIDVWQQLLFDRGSLPVTPLYELDRLMQNGGISLPQLRAGSIEAQNYALAQWLHAVTAIDRPTADIAACAPASSAMDMIADLENLLPLASQITGTTLPSSETFTLNDVSSPPAASAAEMIPEAMKRLGFTLENSLVSAASTQQQPDTEETLKSMLLRLALLTGRKAADAESSVIPETIKQEATEAAQSRQRVSANAPVNIPSDARIADRLISLRRAMVSTLDSESPSLTATLFDRPSASQLQGYTMRQSHPVSEIFMAQEAVQPPVDAPSATIQKIIGHIRDTVALLSEYVLSSNNNISGTQAPLTEPHTGTAAAVTTLSSIAEQLTALADEVAMTVKIASENGAVLSGNASETQQPPLQPFLLLLRTVFDTIDSIIVFFNGETTQHRINGERSAGMTAEERERTIINQSLRESGNNGPETALSRTTLGRTLSTAIDRLESLQLLARQVSTTQGTQQIIAIPIKFGDTWAEINVRLLRRHPHRRSKKNAGHFSVDINVAPPALGSLHAHIDYRRSRQLHLSIEFKRKAAREWFRQHSDEIKQSLISVGIPAVRLDFTSTRPTGDRTVQQGEGNGSGIIDLTI